MKLTYIWHDGFLLETQEANIIFDYWKDVNSSTPKFLADLDKEKPLLVLVSHHHKDHYNPEIFEWSSKFRDITYILSKDTFHMARHMIVPGGIYKGPRRVSPEMVKILAPGDVSEMAGVKIEAFGSTDTGNSYLVTVEGRKIFHAGDLNAWVWKEESSPEEIKAAIDAFTAIIDPIAAANDNLYIAMFPVDARMGRGYWEGASIFVRKFKTDYFVPMHFGLGKDMDEQLHFNYCATRFKKYANPAYGDYVALTGPYSCLETPD